MTVQPGIRDDDIAARRAMRDGNTTAQPVIQAAALRAPKLVASRRPLEPMGK